jgi:hypothetical protein
LRARFIKVPGLNKPQLPSRREVSRGKDWNSIWGGFRSLKEDADAQAVYLQQYLNRLYNQVIPLQYLPMIVTNAESPYTVGAQDVFLAVEAGAGSPTVIILPPAGGTGRVVIVKKTDANAQNITIQPFAGDTIDGGGTYSISVQYVSISLHDTANGTWLIF